MLPAWNVAAIVTAGVVCVSFAITTAPLASTSRLGPMP
jgi:hypothetical protein